MSDYQYRDRAPAKSLRKSKLPSSVHYRMEQPRSGYAAVRPQSSDEVFSFGVLSIGLVAFFAFKVVLVLALNPSDYTDRLSVLSQGTFLERFGARLLDIDPVTQFISQIALYLF